MPRLDVSPAVSPFGDVVVWESCEAGFVHCGIQQSVRSGDTWGAAQLLSGTGSGERNPDTDGLIVTYDSNRLGTLGGGDIFHQPLSGGTETQLEIDGIQRNPSITGGIIAFESKPLGAVAWDLFVYELSTNTYQPSASQVRRSSPSGGARQAKRRR